MIEADPEVKKDRADHRVQEAFGLVGGIGEVAKVPKAIWQLFRRGRAVNHASIVDVEHGDTFVLRRL